jgi:soluble lytic murein transglycosylase
MLILVVLFLVDALTAMIWWRQRRDHRYDAVIRKSAQVYGIDPSLVKAVIWQESGFDCKARGKAQELGLMQIRPGTGGEWAAAERVNSFTPEDLLDPATNTLAGAWYLRKLLRRYGNTDNPSAYALADYNAGRAHVLEWLHDAGTTNSTAFISQIGFPGTRRYVQNVLDRYAYYHPGFSGPTGARP